MNLGKIINYPSTKQIQSVIWRKEWAPEYISPWGIFERFKLANYATSKDIFVVFGTNEANTHVYKRIYRNLIDLNGLSHEKLVATFGTAIFDSTHLLINHFILPLNQGSFNNFYIREQLSYCPECLKSGYHSVFHQFIPLNNCPIHEIALKFQCGQCGGYTRYELSHDTCVKPFHCKCGAPLSGEIVTTNCFDLWLSSSIADKYLSAWIALKQSKLDQLTKLIVLTSPKKETKRGKGLLKIGLFSIGTYPAKGKGDFGQITSNILINTRPEIPTTRWFTKRINYYSSIIIDEEQCILKVKSKILSQMSFERYAYLCLYQLYKAVIRHIKKTQLKGHITCISSYVKRKQTLNACPYAVAYIRLRQEVECKSDPTEVDNSKSKITGFSNESPIPPFFSILYNPLLFEVLTSRVFKETFGILEIVSNNHELWPSAIQIISRAFCHYVVQKYYGWFEFIKKDYSETNAVSDMVNCPRVAIPNPTMTIQLNLINPNLLIAKHQWLNTKSSYCITDAEK
ncbi:hypothetical protein [Desulfotomaculum sp. 1211_IL3151]|uniref:hypothetical protein n=1 Tax=Desulfotomaculum sp. 1211_IL3151 TaxID=3084055 RepID=UPI002FDA765D